MSSQREGTSQVLVRVDGKALTRREFNYYLPEDYQKILTSDERREYLDRWVTTQLLYNEVIQSGAGIGPEVKARLKQYEKDLVADLLVQKVIQENAVVSDAEVLRYYEARERQYKTDYRVSHILVNTLEDAQKVKNQIGKRGFTYLARRYSIDKHSGGGGDLGYLSKGNMIAEFENVVFDMKVGDVSDIIESEFGYHIIKITDIRPARVKLAFEDVHEEIASLLTLEKREAVYDSLVAALYAAAEIEYMDVPGWEAETTIDTVSAAPR
ncbi:MAG: peptidylprolyl isomerase [Candidatus Krumholzibacteriia bacterium]